VRATNIVAGASVGAVAVGFGFGAPPDNVHNGLLALSFAAVGAFVLHHRPGQREARLFLAAGAAQAVLFLGRQVGDTMPRDEPARTVARWVAWSGIWPLPLVLVLVGLTILCFPDGSLPGRRWRPVVVAMAVAGAALSLANALWPVDYARVGVRTAPPFSLPGTETLKPVLAVAQPVVFATFHVLWLASVVVRRRAASADVARQLRWLVLSVGVSAAALAVGLLVQGSPRAGLLSVPLIPIAAGVAIVEASYESLVRDLQSAAGRVVAAHDDARRRIERDLHDGAQHRLVVIGMDLGRLVEQADANGDDGLAAAAAAARDQVLAATAELRELARGIHPSVLSQDGLVAALESVADRSPLPVSLELEGVPVLGPHEEVTAYFVVTEAITNAARHSAAHLVSVRLRSAVDRLHIEVADDGCGGAVMGGGLRGIADRVTSVGGRFELDSPPGHGTRVRVEVPTG
jgi:signal transduction histidine kinase